jgi:predicted acetyltransferase
MELRQPEEGDRADMVDVLRVSLNLPHRWIEERGAKLKPEQFLCAYDGDRVVATSAARAFRQWFGGAEIPMCGVYGVATLPEYRGTGLASRAVGQLLHEARERGTPLAGLYPAAVRPYRGLGFELAGTFTEHAVPLGELPAGAGPLAIDEYRPQDLEGVRACYRGVASTHNGPIDCDDDDWWPVRILGPSFPDKIERAVVARGEGGIDGYASFVYEDATGDLDVSFKIETKHLVAATPEALRSLLGYFRGFRGLGQSLTFHGPSADPLALLVAEQQVKPTWTFRWMLRLLDVAGALEARGYPPVSGQAVVAVDDAVFADNRGPFSIEADHGKVRVSPADAARGRPIPIGVLSSMYTGFLSPHDAVRLGYLDADDPAVALLTDLFAGPVPWMYDFF